MSFRHDVRVRYVECDMQGVVFNAHYLTYVDDAIDTWLASTLGPAHLERFEYQVKKATLEWSSPARLRDTLTIRPHITRWGTTSFDLSATLEVGERPVAVCELVLVSIEPGGSAPVRVPDEVRAALT